MIGVDDRSSRGVLQPRGTVMPELRVGLQLVVLGPQIQSALPARVLRQYDGRGAVCGGHQSAQAARAPYFVDCCCRVADVYGVGVGVEGFGTGRGVGWGQIWSASEHAAIASDVEVIVTLIENDDDVVCAAYAGVFAVAMTRTTPTPILMLTQILIPIPMSTSLSHYQAPATPHVTGGHFVSRGHSKPLLVAATVSQG